MTWKRLVLSTDQEELVDPAMVTADDIIGELKVSYDTGVRSQMKRIISRSLGEFHERPLNRDAVYVMSYGSRCSTPTAKILKSTPKAPLVVDACKDNGGVSDMTVGSVMYPADMPTPSFEGYLGTD